MAAEARPGRATPVPEPSAGPAAQLATRLRNSGRAWQAPKRRVPGAGSNEQRKARQWWRSCATGSGLLRSLVVGERGCRRAHAATMRCRHDVEERAAAACFAISLARSATQRLYSSRIWANTFRSYLNVAAAKPLSAAAIFAAKSSSVSAAMPGSSQQRTRCGPPPGCDCGSARACARRGPRRCRPRSRERTRRSGQCTRETSNKFLELVIVLRRGRIRAS